MYFVEEEFYVRFQETTDWLNQDLNSSLTNGVTCHARADLGVGPGGTRPPPFVREFFFSNISALQVQYGIQAFAKFKRPEYKRLHLRELQFQTFSGRSMRPKLPRKVRRSQNLDW